MTHGQLMEEGQRLERELELSQAATLYENALRLARKLPKNERTQSEAETRNRYAETCLTLGWWDKAERELRQILDSPVDVGPQQKCHAWVTYGHLMGHRGDPEQATTYFLSAQDLADEHGLARELALARCGLAEIAGRTGHLDETLEIVEVALGDFSQLPEHPRNKELHASLLSQLGLYHFRLARLQNAEAALQAALQVLPQQPTLEEAHIRRYLGVMASLRRKPKTALDFHLQALEIFTKAGCSFGQAKVYESIGRTFLGVNRLEEAVHSFRKAESICAQLGASAELATLYGKLGQVFVLREDFEKAAEYLRRDLEISSRFRNYYTLGFSHRNLGRCLILLGSVDEAITHLNSACERFRAVDETLSLGRAHMDLCQAYLRKGRPQEAAEHCNRAREIMTDKGMLLELTFLECLQGSVLRLQGDLKGAEERLLGAIEQLGMQGSSGWLAEANHELGILRLEQGDKQKAVLAFKEAVRVSRQAGLNRESGRYLHELERLHEAELFRTWMEGLEDRPDRAERA